MPLTHTRPLKLEISYSNGYSDGTWTDISHCCKSFDVETVYDEVYDTTVYDIYDSPFYTTRSVAGLKSTKIRARFLYDPVLHDLHRHGGTPFRLRWRYTGDDSEFSGQFVLSQFDARMGVAPFESEFDATMTVVSGIQRTDLSSMFGRLYEITYTQISELKTNKAVENFVASALQSQGFDMSRPIDVYNDNINGVIRYRQTLGPIACSAGDPDTGVFRQPVNALKISAGHSDAHTHRVRKVPPKAEKVPEKHVFRKIKKAQTPADYKKLDSGNDSQ